MSEERPFEFGEVSRLAEAVYQRVMVELRPHLPAGVTQEAHSNLERAWTERNKACNRLLREKRDLEAQVDELQKKLESRDHLLQKLDQEYQALRYKMDPLVRRITAARDALDPAIEAPR